MNCVAEIRGSGGEISSVQMSEATALRLQTMVALTTGDTIKPKGDFLAADGYVAADRTSLLGVKAG